MTNFHFLVNFIRHTDPMVTMVTSYIGSLSQLPVVKISWGKKSKKKPSVLTNFNFLVNFIRHTGPMVTMVTRYTGGLSQHLVIKMSWGKNLSQLPVVKMSWGEKSKKRFLSTFVFWLISSDTLVSWSPEVTSTRVAYLSFQWSI